jgi:tRNA A-37 threonylcarbamoyl transferase component Bud32
MNEWISLKRGRWHWRVRPDWQDRLVGAAGLRLETWHAEGRLQVIKQAPHRTIYRVDLPDASVFIKHYPIHDVRAFLRQRLRPAKAATEMACALALAERRIATVVPIASAAGPAGESYLITLALEGTVRLDDFINHLLEKAPGELNFRLRREIARRLGEFLARMHDAGVSHADLHSGNLLVKPDTLELYLIDLHAVRLGGPLDWPDSKDNLVMLSRWMQGRTQRTDRRRFWRAYASARRIIKVANHNEHRLAGELQAATADSLAHFWRKRTQRCVTPGRHFYRLRMHGNDAWAVADFPSDLLEALLGAPHRPFDCPASRLLKNGRSATVCEFDLVLEGKKRRVIYKRFRATKPSEPWVHLVRPAPAMSSWVNGHALLDRGLPTARPLAVIRRRRFGLVRESYLLTEKLTGVRDLRSHVDQTAKLPNGDQVAMTRLLVERLAVLARELHDRGLSHRDFKASNVLVQTRGATPPPRTLHAVFRPLPRLYLIDLEGVERRRAISRPRKVQNLARLHASFHDHPLLSRTDKLRFLRTYMRWGLNGRQGWKAWWRQIAQATRRKIEQNHRRGRVLT